MSIQKLSTKTLYRRQRAMRSNITLASHDRAKEDARRRAQAEQQELYRQAQAIWAALEATKSEK